MNIRQMSRFFRTLWAWSSSSGSTHLFDQRGSVKIQSSSRRLSLSATVFRLDRLGELCETDRRSLPNIWVCSSMIFMYRGVWPGNSSFCSTLPCSRGDIVILTIYFFRIPLAFRSGSLRRFPLTPLLAFGRN